MMDDAATQPGRTPANRLRRGRGRERTSLRTVPAALLRRRGIAPASGHSGHSRRRLAGSRRGSRAALGKARGAARDRPQIGASGPRPHRPRPASEPRCADRGLQAKIEDHLSEPEPGGTAAPAAPGMRAAKYHRQRRVGSASKGLAWLREAGHDGPVAPALQVIRSTAGGSPRHGAARAPRRSRSFAT